MDLIDAYTLVSKRFFEIGDFEKAKYYCQICIDLGDLVSYHKMGVILIYEGKPYESLYCFDRTKYMFRESYYYMGIAYKNLGDYAEAEKCFLENGESKAFYALAEMYNEQNNHEGSKIWYLEAALLGDKRAAMKIRY